MPLVKWQLEDGGSRFILFPSAGESVPVHQHNTDHLSSCQQGALELTIDDWTVVLRPGDAPLNVPADAWHGMRALAPDTIGLCRFQHYDGTRWSKEARGYAAASPA